MTILMVITILSIGQALDVLCTVMSTNLCRTSVNTRKRILVAIKTIRNHQASVFLSLRLNVCVHLWCPFLRLINYSRKKNDALHTTVKAVEYT